MKDYRELLDADLSREHYLKSLEKISIERRRLENPHTYKVNLSIPLINLKYELIKKIKETI